MPGIFFKSDYYSFRIYFDGVLHFILDRKVLIGIHAYRLRDKCYCIEYITITKTITCEYEEREIWIKIMEEIDKIGL